MAVIAAVAGFLASFTKQAFDAVRSVAGKPRAAKDDTSAHTIANLKRELDDRDKQLRAQDRERISQRFKVVEADVLRLTDDLRVTNGLVTTLVEKIGALLKAKP